MWAGVPASAGTRRASHRRRRSPPSNETLGAKAAAGDESGLRGAVGTPAQLREFLRRYEAAGVDQLIFVMQAGRNRHEHIMESIELFGTEVLPEFAERDEASSAAKAEKWAPLIERAMTRKVDTAPPMPADYVMKALPKQVIDARGTSRRSSGSKGSPTSRRRACSTRSSAV